jgi:hypothetical protein
MKKKSTRDTPRRIMDFDPIIPCAWLPDREVRLSEYEEMITYFVQKRMRERENAEPLYPKKLTDR